MVPTYEIRIRGHLSARWRGVFEPFEIATTEGELTVLRGEVADQAVLHGVLRRCEDNGLSLVSLRCVDEAGLAAR